MYWQSTEYVISEPLCGAGIHTSPQTGQRAKPPEKQSIKKRSGIRVEGNAQEGRQGHEGEEQRAKQKNKKADSEFDFAARLRVAATSWCLSPKPFAVGLPFYCPCVAGRISLCGSAKAMYSPV